MSDEVVIRLDEIANDIWQPTSMLRFKGLSPDGHAYGKPVLQQKWVSRSGLTEWREVPYVV